MEDLKGVKMEVKMEDLNGVKMEVKMEVKKGVKKDNGSSYTTAAAHHLSTLTPPLTPTLTPPLTPQKPI